MTRQPNLLLGNVAWIGLWLLISCSHMLPPHSSGEVQSYICK